MVKQILPAIAFIFFLSSCSTFKPLNFTSNRQVASVAAPTPQTKFIDDITVTAQASIDKTVVITEPKETFTSGGLSIAETNVMTEEAKNLTEIVSSSTNVR
jgi:PBP1b-binding outer membrane lipoprotein LpoB